MTDCSRRNDISIQKNFITIEEKYNEKDFIFYKNCHIFYKDNNKTIFKIDNCNFIIRFLGYKICEDRIKNFEGWKTYIN